MWHLSYFQKLSKMLTNYWNSTAEQTEHVKSWYFDFFGRAIRLELKQQVSQVQNKYPSLVPGLAIVQVGGLIDSNVYIRMKIRAAAEIGINAQHIKLPQTITQSELLTKVRPL